MGTKPRLGPSRAHVLNLRTTFPPSVRVRFGRTSWFVTSESPVVVVTTTNNHSRTMRRLSPLLSCFALQKYLTTIWSVIDFSWCVWHAQSTKEVGGWKSSISYTYDCRIWKQTDYFGIKLGMRNCLISGFD